MHFFFPPSILTPPYWDFTHVVPLRQALFLPTTCQLFRISLETPCMHARSRLSWTVCSNLCNSPIQIYINKNFSPPFLPWETRWGSVSNSNLFFFLSFSFPLNSFQIGWKGKSHVCRGSLRKQIWPAKESTNVMRGCFEAQVCQSVI